MTQINIIALGSRGDVQPHVVQAVALQQAGYSVRLLAPHVFANFAAQHNVPFAPLQGDVQGMLLSDDGKELLKTRNPLKMAAKMRDMAQPILRKGTLDAIEACRDADLLLIGGTGGWIGLNVMDALNIPATPCYLQPMVPSGDYFSCIMPQPPIPMPRFINRWSTALSFDGFWQMVRAPFNEIREKELGLPPMPRWGVFTDYFKRREPILMAFSQHVLPRSADWTPNIHLTGYWYLNDADQYEPPSGLVAFLQAGPPPVYIGFGSMNNEDPAETTRLVLRALELSGQRGVLLSGWGGLDTAQLPPSVFHLSSTSHHWLLPQMAAVVHHGGAGTTAAGLRSGVPSIVVPFFGDQPFWANRVHALGAGPKPIARRNLSAENFAAAIKTAVTDQTMRQRAADIGRKLNEEDGVGNMVVQVHKIVADLRLTQSV